MALIVTPKDLAQRAELYQQLASLMTAGVGVLQALDLLHRSPPTRSFRGPIARTRARIEAGYTFSESLASEGHWIPPFDLALIQAGEQAGRLAECCRLLSRYYEERAQMVRRVIGDLVYPLLIVHLAVIIFPTSQLTGLLQDLSPLEFLLRKLAILLPGYMVVALLVFAGQAKRAEPMRVIVEQVLGLVPLVGNARRHLALARLSAALEALISAGVTIIEAWELAAKASGSPALQRAVQRWRPRLDAGESPAELLPASPAFPELFANLYATGELSGQIDETLRRLHLHYQEEGSRKLQLVARWMPMVVYLVVVGVIAYNIISFWSGYYRNIGDVLNF